MKVDGRLDEWPEEMPWQKVTHAMGEGVATNDADISFAFASAADKENLYLGLRIADDKKVLNKIEGRDAANEDSVELEIAGTRVMVKRHHIYRQDAKGNVVASAKQFVALKNGVSAVIIDGNEGWDVEVRIPHASTGINSEDAAAVPFNITLNDDDDGGERDNQINWHRAATTPAAEGEVPSLNLVTIPPS
jgi:hypothetical protein